MIPKNSIKTRSFPISFSIPATQPDIYCDDDEDQLAAEMERSLLDIMQDQPLPDIDPDDFEKLYHWFYS